MSQKIPSPLSVFGSALALRLLIVCTSPWIATTTAISLAPLLVGGTLLGLRSLVGDLRAERRERLEGLAGTRPDPRLSKRLLRLTRRAGIEPLPVHLVETPGMSASICGARRTDQTILIGRELQQLLRGQGLEAMLAHELGHAVYRDVAWGIAARALFGLLSGTLLAALALAGPAGLFGALFLALAIRSLKARLQMLFARVIERRADRFAARLVGAEPLTRALRRTHRHERAQLALSAALERAARHGLAARRIDRASALLLDPSTSTRRLISAERGLTADLPPEMQAEIRRIRRQDPWAGREGAVYGSISERLGRIRGASGA